MWDYAKLSQAAKASGGPEKLVEQIFLEGVSRGKASMIPWMLGAVGITALCTYAIPKIVQFSKRCHRIKMLEMKQELIDGIKQYDLEQEQLQEATDTGM